MITRMLECLWISAAQYRNCNLPPPPSAGKSPEATQKFVDRKPITVNKHIFSFGDDADVAQVEEGWRTQDIALSLCLQAAALHLL